MSTLQRRLRFCASAPGAFFPVSITFLAHAGWHDGERDKAKDPDGPLRHFCGDCATLLYIRWRWFCLMMVGIDGDADTAAAQAASALGHVGDRRHRR